jgi:hypothetical protein
MDKAGVSRMGGIRGWIARQIARTPGEWIRAHIADKIIEAIFGHGLYSKSAIVVIAIISMLGGAWTGFLALVQRDPSVAVWIGLSVAVLLFIVIRVLISAILWARGLFSATAPSSPLSDISWDFERTKFLDVARSASKDQTVWVRAFRAQGHNNTGGPIKNVSGIVRSDLNNKEIPINFRIGSEIVRPEGTYGIPRDASFILESDRFSPNTTLGMRREEFLEQFGAFTFELNYDGGKYVRHFSRPDSEQCISRYIANFDLASPKPPPMVTKKDRAT